MFTTVYSWSLSELNESSLHHSSPFLQGPFKNHFNIILLHIPRSSMWCISNVSHVLHLCQSHLPWFDHSHSILQQVVFRKLPTVHFLPDSCYFHPSRSKYSLQHPLLKHHKSMCFLWHKTWSFTPSQTGRQNILNGMVTRIPQNLICFLSLYESNFNLFRLFPISQYIQRVHSISLCYYFVLKSGDETCTYT